jgi:hypothetical protein
MTRQKEKVKRDMSKWKDEHIKRLNWAKDIDAIDRLVTDALRAAAVAEQQFFFDGEENYSKKFFEQVTLPLHQIVAFLRNGEETDNG